MIEQLKREYPVKALCEALGCPVSTRYYPSVEADESRLVAAAEQILLRFPFYGYRKLSQALARAGYPIGEHVTRRLLRQVGMSRSVGQVRVQTTDSHHAHPRYPNRIKGLKLSAPDQVWVADITSACRTKPVRPRTGLLSASCALSRKNTSITANMLTLTMLTGS